jgi:hypothetical protein
MEPNSARRPSLRSAPSLLSCTGTRARGGVRPASRGSPGTGRIHWERAPGGGAGTTASASVMPSEPYLPPPPSWCAPGSPNTGHPRTASG